MAQRTSRPPAAARADDVTDDELLDDGDDALTGELTEDLVEHDDDADADRDDDEVVDDTTDDASDEERAATDDEDDEDLADDAGEAEDAGEEADDVDDDGEDDGEEEPERSYVVPVFRDGQQVGERHLTRFYREMRIERPTRADGESAAAAEPDQVELSFSSETPVLRYDWWTDEEFYEVLDHASSGAADLSRLQDNGPLLLDHMRWVHIGALSNVRIEGGIGRASARFSRSQQGSEVKQDVLDGIRDKTSVGYEITRMTLESIGEDEIPVYRCAWKAYEVSLTAIPADMAVGVGRSARRGARSHRRNIPASSTAPQAKEQTVAIRTTAAAGAAPNVPPAPGRVTRAQVRESVMGEVKEITKLAEQHRCMDKLPKWIEDGRSVDSVREEIMESYRARGADPVVRPAGQDILDIPNAENRRFSVGRALRAALTANWENAGYEREVSNALGKRLGMETQGFFVPTFRTGRPAPAMQERTVINTQSAGVGAELVYSEYHGFIEKLRNRAMVLKLGANFISGLQGGYSKVKESSLPTSYWVGENPGVDVTETQLGTGIFTINPKSLAARMRYTRQQLQQSVEAVDALVESRLVLEHAQALDKAGIAGTGTAFQPLGIVNTPGVNIVSLGANGATPTYANVIDAKTSINVANALDLGTQAFLTTPELQGTFEKMAKLANTIAAAAWEDGKMAGFRAESSNNVPKNLTKGSGTNLHALLFGVWNALDILEWGALEMIVDPYTQAGQQIVVVTSNQLVNTSMDHPEAFTVFKDAIPN